MQKKVHLLIGNFKFINILLSNIELEFLFQTPERSLQNWFLTLEISVSRIPRISCQASGRTSYKSKAVITKRMYSIQKNYHVFQVRAPLSYNTYMCLIICYKSKVCFAKSADFKIPTRKVVNLCSIQAIFLTK